jgi:RNA polymerase sigma factor (sigma-70 family)
MVLLPDTRASLLLRLRDSADQQAWEEFSMVYEPAVYRLARRRGLQHADAMDLTQDVLTTVAKTISNWDTNPDRGRFRSWLFTVARNCAVNSLIRGKRHQASGDTEMLERLHELPSRANETTAEFRLEYRRQAFGRAAEVVRREVLESTWQAFWLTAVDGLDANQAAGQLGISTGAVYASRSRVLARLRRQVERLEGSECT